VEALAHVHQHEKSIYKKNCLVQANSKADICAKQLKMINIAQIKTKFLKLPIEKIGYESGFIQIENKLTALSFVLGFFESYSNTGEVKTSLWAQNISHIIGQVISIQGLSKRLGYKCIAMCEQILSSALSYSLSKVAQLHLQGGCFGHFSKIYLEDSTCLKLPKLLYSTFGGGSNQKESYALCRIQLRLELLSETIQSISLHKYGENDVSFAHTIIQSLREGQLVIRDLGYFALDVFERIHLLGAFFISRWHPQTKLVCPKTLKVINLGEMLQKAQQNGLQVIEQELLLGLQKQFKVRWIALRVPQEVEDKRREKALKKQKSKGIKYKESYFEHLGWSIYITNVPTDKLTYLDIWRLYQFRWRIEIIFKAWKSHLKIANCLKDTHCLNPCPIIIRLYLMMTWIVLCLVPAYNYFQYKLYQAHKRFVSLAKFADYYRNNFQKFVNELEWDDNIPFIKAFCLYEKRKTENNYFEKLYILNSC
jgi:Transposase DDE domain